MDFSNILDSINSSIPSNIAGIDTLYIAAGAIVFILLVWILLKKNRHEPKRDLVELMPAGTDEEDSGAEDAIEESKEEEGFMPSELPSEPQEIHVSHEEQESEPVEEVLPEEEVAPSIVHEEVVKTVSKSSRSTRKKRESQRHGQKISKANFTDFSGKRLLIAEDNLINQKVINGVLNESGIDVVMADDGQIVLDILEKDSDFEIILMDAHMPRVDGFEATRKIRENPAYDHIAVVALSGDTAADDIRHMREAGMEESLEKPLKMDMLYDVMSMYYTMDEPKAEASDEPVVEELEIDVNVDDLSSLDYDLGLDICGGDETMYKELLREFFMTYKESPKKLREALMQKEYDAVQSILIDLKGTASNLGAKQIIYVVDRFMKELADKNTAAYGALFKDYQNYLLVLLKSIQAAFKV